MQEIKVVTLTLEQLAERDAQIIERTIQATMSTMMDLKRLDEKAFIPAATIATDKKMNKVYLLSKIRASGVETERQGREICVRICDIPTVLKAKTA